jgi:hypothetical protein
VIDELVHWLGGEAKTVAFAILSGVLGFLAKGAYDLWLARRKDKLERINQQLKLLYGPLYSINQSSQLAWAAFRGRTRPGKAFFGTEPPPTQEELLAWRYWIQTVFGPMHAEMMSAITKNADLLIEDDIPDSLRLFCAHVAVYKVVLARWEDHDFSEYTSILNYPAQELTIYLQKSFEKLKAEQRRLLGGPRSSTSIEPRKNSDVPQSGS